MGMFCKFGLFELNRPVASLGRVGDHVRLTELGGQTFDAAAEVQRELNDERRRGVSDDDYATTIEVLQRTITNVGGSAWHW